MKKLYFTKMQSLGNDFVIIDQLKNPIKFSKNDIKKISNRNYGIGCDQVLVLEKSEKKEIAFKYKIYNKDGTESGQCGNGAKCIGKYYFDKYGKNRKEIKIETISRRMSLRILKNSLIEVDMGLPLFNFKEYKSSKNLFSFKGKKHYFSAISIGNPHAVFFIKNINKVDLADFANNFNKKLFFNGDVNISIVEEIKKNNWWARIYERGAGETMACGSAACAISLSTSTIKDISSKNNYVHMHGGKAQVKWSGNITEPVYLIGSSQYVFDGNYKI